MNRDKRISQSGRWLAIDTSTAVMSLAVMDNGELLGQSNTEANKDHSTLLIPGIQRLMADLNVKMSDLSGIAIGCGPGSYTGVRIGVTVAKTLAWAQQLPLVKVSSLEALAYGGLRKLGWAAEFEGNDRANETSGIDGIDRTAGDNCWVIPLLDARRRQAYTALYEKRPDSWACLSVDGIRPIAGWIGLLSERLDGGMESASRLRPKNGLDHEQATGGLDAELDHEYATRVAAITLPERIVFVGETGLFTAEIERLQDHWKGPVLAANVDTCAIDVGLLALDRWLQGEMEDVHSLVPNYTQLPEAEKNLLEKAKGRVG